MKPRILIFSLAPLSAVGGAELATRELVRRLSSDFEFEVLSANVKNFWSKYLFPWWAGREAGRRHRRKPYDLVWAIMANQAGMAAARFKAKFPAVPFLLTLQEGDDLDSWAYRFRLLGPRWFGVFRRPDRIQAISHYLARWAKQMGARCPIVVVPNGVETGSDSPESSRPDSFSSSPRIIITTSRLVRKNGIDILIKALALLPSDVRLKIIGDGPERRPLERLAARLKVVKRIDFLGVLPLEQINEHLRGASVFARPSRSEGLGNSFLEAMAAGLPVIGTPVGGIPDFLRNGETGWLVPPDDSRALAEKIKFLLDPVNQASVDTVISVGRRLVFDEYRWDLIASKMSAILQTLCASS